MLTSPSPQWWRKNEERTPALNRTRWPNPWHGYWADEIENCSLVTQTPSLAGRTPHAFRATRALPSRAEWVSRDSRDARLTVVAQGIRNSWLPREYVMVCLNNFVGWQGSKTPLIEHEEGASDLTERETSWVGNHSYWVGASLARAGKQPLEPCEDQRCQGGTWDFRPYNTLFYHQGLLKDSGIPSTSTWA